MAIEGEPRNGDYAAYIEALSRRGAGPGQTLRELDSHTTSRTGWADMPTNVGKPEIYPTPGTGTAPYTPYTPAPRSAAPRATPPVPGKVADRSDFGQDDGATTLSKQNERQRVSIVMLIVGGVIGLIGASMVIGGLLDQDGDVIPGLFLLVFAWIFTRGAWRQRRRASAPLAKLPPLSTISSRERNK